MKRITNRDTFRLFHVCFAKIDISYDDFKDHTIYQEMTPFTLPQNMSVKDAFMVISYLSKKVATENKVANNSLQCAYLTNRMLSKYRFKSASTKSRMVDLISVSGFKKDLSSDPVCQSRYFEWYCPSVDRAQVSAIYKKCGLNLDDIESTLER